MVLYRKDIPSQASSDASATPTDTKQSLQTNLTFVHLTSINISCHTFTAGIMTQLHAELIICVCGSVCGGQAIKRARYHSHTFGDRFTVYKAQRITVSMYVNLSHSWWL